jgi:hypothetical protein
MKRLLLLALLVAGCTSAPAATTIDGLRLGPQDSTGPGTNLFTDYGRTLLDKTPHAAVTATEVYERYLPPGRIETFSGGGAGIVVFRLADGSARAFDIVCGIGVQPTECAPAAPPMP